LCIAANTGDVFASALSSAMTDHEDQGEGQDDDDRDCETNDG